MMRTFYLWPRPRGSRCLLKHGMRIRAAHTERTNAAYTGTIDLRPCDWFSWNNHWKFGPGNVWIGIVEVQVRSNFAMLKRQDHLHQTDNSRRRFKVTEIGFC